MTADALISGVRDEVLGWRRHLHQNPELSFHEHDTARFVRETLESLPGLVVTQPTATSVMARLVTGRPGKVLAIRADMDGLPILEENGFDFRSQRPGVMHACGHDAHMAMVLGAAKVLSAMADQLVGEVRFLFQHAEELFPGGAEEMIQAGVMEGVDLVIGAHVWAPLEVGKIGIVHGPAMAAPDTFWITIHGKGGHAAMPHQTVDPIVVGAQVVSGLQHIVSRAVDPLGTLVVSVTQFVAGTTHNVIPGSVEMQGTVRTFDPALRRSIPALMERFVQGITQAHGATYEIRYQHGYDTVDNEATVTALIESTVREVLGDQAVDPMRPTMGGEDFSAFQTRAPGCFFFVGAGNPGKGIVHPHHHARFTIDEDALEVGLKVFVHTAARVLSDRPGTTPHSSASGLAGQGLPAA
jgi:amidohydrolase